MAGATKEHNKIVASLIATIGQHLKGKGCTYFPSALRVLNPYNGRYTYPDVTIVCGKEQYLDNKSDTLLNPTVLFEVLSTTTEDDDRVTKFKLYRQFQHYKIISLSVAQNMLPQEAMTNGYYVLQNTKMTIFHTSAINYDFALSDMYVQISEFSEEQ